MNPAEVAETEEGLVAIDASRVADGDTVTLIEDLKKVKVRQKDLKQRTRVKIISAS